MKKPLLVAALLVGSLGCANSGHNWLDTRSLKAPLERPALPLPPSPVTADQVDSANAHRAAEAVWDEMDRER